MYMLRNTIEPFSIKERFLRSFLLAKLFFGPEVELVDSLRFTVVNGCLLRLVSAKRRLFLRLSVNEW